MRDAWYIAAALIALGQRPPAQRRADFGRADLEQLCPDFKRRRTTTTAIEHLRSLGFLTGSPGAHAPGQPRYVLTPEGAEAAQAAATARQRAEQAAASPFARRLWNLFRARKQLTSVQAAELLADAGGEQNIASVRSLAAQYLRSWSRAYPEAVQISVKRVGRAKRYVLTRDLGPSVPMAEIEATA